MVKTNQKGLKIVLVGWIYSLARRTKPGIAFILEYLPVLIPAHRLIETDTVLAFEHPNPSYPVHILIVPRLDIAGLSDLDSSNDALLGQVFEVVRRLVVSLGLEESGYRLIVNGGKYQDFPLLHFHLVSGSLNQPE